ncbi:MAG: hypothetical protein ACREU6_14630 [Steroidobacteraceae bacterium]
MKTHRPWQPHMGNTPLFNPYTPVTGRATTLDHFDLVEEEDEAEASGEQPTDQADDPASRLERD